MALATGLLHLGDLTTLSRGRWDVVAHRNASFRVYHVLPGPVPPVDTSTMRLSWRALATC